MSLFRRLLLLNNRLRQKVIVSIAFDVRWLYHKVSKRRPYLYLLGQLKMSCGFHNRLKYFVIDKKFTSKVLKQKRCNNSLCEFISSKNVYMNLFVASLYGLMTFGDWRKITK